MKHVEYGPIHRRHIGKHLVFVCFINYWIASFIYLLCSLIQPLPLYCFVIYLIIHYTVVFIWLQRKEPKQRVLFDTQGIQVYTYPAWIYVSLLFKQEPQMKQYIYQNTSCSLTYQKADKKSTQRYHFVIHVENESTSDDIEIQTSAISNTKLNWVLLMLSSSSKSFRDDNHLQLCLLHHKDAFDYYIERMREEHYEKR